MTRLFAAISLFAVEMQVATWLSLGTLESIALVNVVLTVVAVAFALRRRGVREATRGARPAPGPALVVGMKESLLEFAPVVVLVVSVFALNVMRPVLAADPYHLDRMAQINRLGTISYDLTAEPKVNSLGWTYELVLADFNQIPYAGAALLRLHGLFGIAMYLLALAAARTWLSGRDAWGTAALLVVPVVFHQFVLIKNDLFGAVPAVVALSWLVARAEAASPKEIAWAAWLCGFAIATKLTSAPLALVFAGVLLLLRSDRAAVLGAGLVGSAVGLACGGFFFSVFENTRAYGSPIAALNASGVSDNDNDSAGQAALSVVRFGISLFDLGLLTRVIWPGRGGWGTTFGLPLIWSFAVLLTYRRRPEVKRAFWIAAVYMIVFAAFYTDADIAHRLMLAPGLLLILVAISVIGNDPRRSPLLYRALYGVVALSALQIGRSAMLYFRS